MKTRTLVLRIITGLIALSIVLGVAGFIYIQFFDGSLPYISAYLEQRAARKTTDAPQLSVVPVRIQLPVLRDLQQNFMTQGVVESNTMVTVLPQVGGLLDKLSVEEGDVVTAGSVLGEIDKEPLTLQLNQAETAYLTAKSSYDRVKTLFESGAATRQNYEQVKAQYEATLSQYELAKLQVAYADIKAPITGTVMIRHASEGSLVGQQVPIVTLADLSELVVRIRVPEYYYELFLTSGASMKIVVSRGETLGSSAEVSSSAAGPGKTDISLMDNKTQVSGRVARISPYISPESKTFEVTLQLEGDLTLLRPGMRVMTQVVIREAAQVYSLPYEVLTAGGEAWFVDPVTFEAYKTIFTLTEDMLDYFQVPEADKNRWFIIEGQHFLQEGQMVRVLNPEAGTRQEAAP